MTVEEFQLSNRNQTEIVVSPAARRGCDTVTLKHSYHFRYAKPAAKVELSKNKNKKMVSI
jgi:hypothetical protein